MAVDFKTAGAGLVSLLIRRCTGPFALRRRLLRRSQWYDADALKDLQLNLLRRLLAHCYATVPYYRKVMDEKGIGVDDIQTLDAIAAFPIINKTDILAAQSEFVSTRYPRWLQRTAFTGGTTGTPMTIQRDLFALGTEQAFLRRQYEWAGLGLRDACAFLTGRTVAKPGQTDKLYAYDPFMKELILSTYHLSSETAEDYARQIVRYGVKGLVGFPSAIHLLAQVCLDRGVETPLRAVLTSSETLTGAMRETITKAFSCPVFDYYGSAERVCYIFTCEQGRYHVQPEYGLTELIPVSEAEPNRCKVVSTGFWSWAMPLIRYEMGDTVITSEEKCPCGRAFPVVERVEGRQVDGISTPSGRRFGAAVLTHLVYGAGNILESQIVQDALDHITIKYVPTSGFGPQDMQAFERIVRSHLPEELKVTYERVTGIERTKSGKLRPVVSLIE